MFLATIILPNFISLISISYDKCVKSRRRNRGNGKKEKAKKLRGWWHATNISKDFTDGRQNSI